MLGAEVIVHSVDLPVGRPCGGYTQLLKHLCDNVYGSGPCVRLEAMPPVPQWDFVRFSVLRPVADEPADPAQAGFEFPFA